jgi:Nif-specific regulatory protein
MLRTQAPTDSDRVRQERDLYLRLLQLGGQEELEHLLQEALGLIVELVGARQGYLEVHVPVDQSERRWWIAHGFSADDVDKIRSQVSQGIIGHALATGQTIVTASASDDPRFRERASVRDGHFEAVLCAPIGQAPPFGVLYLQRRQSHGVFEEHDRAAAELFARHLAPLADRLLTRHRTHEDEDHTRHLRTLLRADGVIGRSPAFAQVLRQVGLVAPLDVTLLLTGESGTGKSQLARVIHDNGPRRDGPFVELNCATLPDTLVESELFGALPGAHSMATRRIEGKVAAAERGTLLLDEIADLTMPVQAKLLQLLQSKQYYPLGATKPVHADVRLIAATNTDLRAAVAERRFREDLFYRLEVVPLRVPSLAERREDIPDLAEHFCAAASARHQLPLLRPSPGGLRALEAADWPGNVRQLAHAVEAAVIRAAGEGARQVEPSHLFPEAPEASAEPRGPLTFQEATRGFHARLLRETLEDCRWNVPEAARRLDLARSHVYNLIRALGLERPR